MQETKPAIGSVSRATLQVCDLIPAFSDTLAEHDPDEFTRLRRTYRDLYNHDAGWEELCAVCEGCNDLLHDLQQTLDAIAPEFTFFGTRERDFSEFGWWIDWDSIRDAEHDGELLKIDAGDEWPQPLPDGVEHVLEVNDHGNATLRTRDGETVWEVV